MDMKHIKKDFEFIKGRALGVVLFGSWAKGEESIRSDIDICLISPEIPLMEILKQVGGKYDLKILEDLPLPVKMDIIQEHEVVIGDAVELSWYFYNFRKLWADTKYRMERYYFESADEMLETRRNWLNERKAKVYEEA
ncbi:MAG: nucleotidyltransferase domain-containing protein [Candidatus Altiarchaeota archaeon]|nr:nucleotidyltransferase domain-containing protein [Candidatus Altiarchaeota archaeon]